jgi:hypothetical protein
MEKTEICKTITSVDLLVTKLIEILFVVWKMNHANIGLSNAPWTYKNPNAE